MNTPVILSLLAVVASTSTITAQFVPNRYIAVLKDDVRDVPVAAQALAAQHGLAVGCVYEHALKGFAFGGAPRAAAALAARAEVAYVEQDQEFHAVVDTSVLPTGIDRVEADAALPIATGQGVSLANAGVTVAVIDTGAGPHPDLNIVGGIHYYVRGFFSVVSDGNYADDNGHGTHVSGTIGAKDDGVNLGKEVVGVAPGVKIYAVKVLNANGSGYTSAIIKGMDHVTANAATIQVANMSLGGGVSQAMDDAIKRGTDAGIVYVVAAGNSDEDVSTCSPARAPSAITVSALADSDGKAGGTGGSFYTSDGKFYTADDTFAPFSNWGAGVDICAPGVAILSTIPGGGYDGTYSGTSMAAPHVAGAAALYIAVNGPTSVEAVTAALKTTGWKSGDPEYLKGGDPDGIAEPLLNVGALITPPTPNNAPVITIVPVPVNVAEDIPVEFTATATDADNDALTYTWSFGDGATANGQNVLHTYLWGENFTVTVTVTDGKGGSATSTTTAAITEVNDFPIVNAGGPYSGVVGMAVTFNGSATDFDNQDGTTANDQTLTYSWNFGDGSTGTGATPTHTYAAGTYTAALTVSDALSSITASTSVTIKPSPSISLTATGYKVKGKQKVDLSWTGATSTVDVYRNGMRIATATANDGFYTDNVNKTGGGTYTYYLISNGLQSNEATVIFQ
jgi:chitodextrinase